MRALLFRRINVDGVNYYQIFGKDENFEVDPIFAEYHNRANHDFFYIDLDSGIEIPDETEYRIYCDNDSKKDGLKLVTDPIINDIVANKFNEIYHYFGTEKKIDDIIDIVSEKVLFQDRAISNLVNQIYLNQDIVTSDLPVELKANQKNNILFAGKVGSGKKTIIGEIEKELDIPYVDIKLGNEPKEALTAIVKGLLETSKGGKEASHGVVFIRDNYEDLIDAMGDKFYEFINFITSQGKVEYKGQVVDFRTVTFVVLYDIYNKTDIEEVSAFENIANCTCRICTRNLSNTDKLEILYSPNGRIYQYDKFLKSKGKKLDVDFDSLCEIIEACSKVDPNMLLLNAMIDGIFKMCLSDGICDVHIDQRIVEDILPIISLQKPIERKETVKDDEEFWFEKKVDEIVNEVTKDVVGQDRAVRMIVHQLLKNLRWANKDDVDNPKQYIKNILIRGNTGTGKTFISSTILKHLGVPYVIADATEYTEAGYVGKDVEDMLVSLYYAAGGDLEKAERGILVIDEVDKRASHGGGGHDVSGSGVQEALYKFAEGTKIRINVGDRMNEKFIYFDTSRLTIICSGAFEGIEAIRDERVGRKKVGFGNQDVSAEDAALTDNDYIAYGMKSQFMRRVKQIVELTDVSKEQFIDIMKKSRCSALKVEKDTYEDQGIEIEYTDDFYDALAEKALTMKQGVTGIEKALLRVFQSINIQDIKPSQYKKIVLNGNVVNNPYDVILEERDTAKVKRIK